MNDHAPASARDEPRQPGKTRATRSAFSTEDAHFVRRLFFVAAVGALLYAIWILADVLLLAFGALLLAVIVRAFVDVVAHVTKLPDPWAFSVGLVLLIALLVGFGVFFTLTLQSQVVDVLDQLPDAVDRLGARFGIDNPLAEAEDRLTSGGDGSSTLLGRVAGLGVTVLGGVVDVLVVLVASIYLAYDPALYRRTIVRLFPVERQGRIEEAMLTTGNALRLWFFGQLVSMALVGLLAGLGFWWIGLPSPAALGLIAGVTNFIPFIGPFIGSAPAVVFAFGDGLATVGWTILIVTVVQQLEGNVFLPLIQRRAVSLAPAFALLAIVAFGLIFGFIGVVLAVPMAVTIMVLVKMLWMRETLGEETSVPGEESRD